MQFKKKERSLRKEMSQVPFKNYAPFVLWNNVLWNIRTTSTMKENCNKIVFNNFFPSFRLSSYENRYFIINSLLLEKYILNK